MSDTQATKVLLKLKDGDVLSFKDNVFGGGGGCDTCGWGGEPETDITITFSVQGRQRIEEIGGVTGSLALTYVMQNLSRIPEMTVDGFMAELTAFCKVSK